MTPVLDHADILHISPEALDILLLAVVEMIHVQVFGDFALAERFVPEYSLTGDAADFLVF